MEDKNTKFEKMLQKYLRESEENIKKARLKKKHKKRKKR